MSKIKSYCAYQERSISDVEDKLRQWAVQSSSVPYIINLLQKEDYLNEERFVKSFARGKFRIKKWGRYRIESELRM
ncbi:MAG: RecX family transcriptional regulator, partial [Bacteroidota bacterium]